jgi:organic radical activating enzyme
MTSKFCPLPWNHIASHPAGYVTLCCEADHTGLRSASYDITDPTIFDGQPSFYNLKYNHLNDVMNSHSFCNVRKQMLAGEEPAPCSGCYRKEEKGLESKRTRETKNFPTMTEELARSITKEDGSITPRIEFVELRLGNICNLRCVTCNPLSSSQWRSDYLKLAEKFDFVKDKYQMMDRDRFTTWPIGYTNSNVFELDWPESDIFWRDLEQLSSDLKVIYINGGEPTLIKKHWEFLSSLIISDRAKNIELNYSINMTNIPEYAYPLWAAFKKVRISCSIDAIGEKNTYIRYPTKWDEVVSNYAKLKASNVEVSITQTISALNYDSLDEFSKFFHEGYIHYNFVTDPAYYSPAILPQEYRDELHKRYEATLPAYLQVQLVKAFGGMKTDETNLEIFKNITNQLDQIRKTQFKETFPELAQKLDAQ